jgi:hypothetical protein
MNSAQPTRFRNRKSGYSPHGWPQLGDAQVDGAHPEAHPHQHQPGGFLQADRDQRRVQGNTKKRRAQEPPQQRGDADDDQQPGELRAQHRRRFAVPQRQRQQHYGAIPSVADQNRREDRQRDQERDRDVKLAVTSHGSEDSEQSFDRPRPGGTADQRRRQLVVGRLETGHGGGKTGICQRLGQRVLQLGGHPPLDGEQVVGCQASLTCPDELGLALELLQLLTHFRHQ